MWKILWLLSVLSVNQVITQERRNEFNCYSLTWTEVVNTTSTEVTVRWRCCNSKVIPSYRLKMNSSQTNCGCDAEKDQLTNKCFHTFSNLCPDTIYQLTISNYKPAGNISGSSSSSSFIYYRNFRENPVTITVQTQSSTPGKLTTTEANAINNTAVKLNWEHDCPNGEVMYKVTWSPDEDTALTQELELTVVDLKPATLYTFVINACNHINRTMCSDFYPVLVKTFPGEPSEPTKFQASDVTSSDVHLQWNHPEVPQGPIDGYEIVCRPESNANFESITTLTNKTEYLVTGLESWTNYSCSIQAFNLQDVNKIAGNPSTLTIFTKLARPDEPSHLQIVDKTSHDILLKWKHPFVPRGPIDGYVVRVSNGKNEIENITYSEDFRLSGLSTWTQYNITVHAFNVDGNNILSGKMSTISVKTRPAKPSAPRDVKVVSTISGQTYLKWKRPLISNGELHGYYVKNLKDESEVILPASILEHHLNTLIPDTNYTFSVHAYNVDGTERLDGTAAYVNHTTKPEGLYITDSAVGEMIHLLRKDIISEFSKTQAMIRKMLRNFVEESRK